MTTLTWAFGAAFLVAFLLFILMASLAMKHASRANDAECRLRTSLQAHALDVRALTKKLQVARAATANRQEEQTS